MIIRWITALLISAGLFHLDASAQWLKIPLPMPYATGYYLDVVFLPSNPNYGWACSLEGYVVRTTDGGATWRGSQVSRPFLETIQFLTPRIGYTSGPAGIYRSDDGGATWRDITPIDPNREKSWGCYFINQDEGVFLVGGCATGLQSYFRTTNGGQSWSVSYSNEAQSGLSDAIIDRSGIGFAVSSGVLWRTADFGRSWRLHARTGGKIWTEEIAWINKTFLLPTSGTDCDGQTPGVGSLRWSSDDGRTWREFQTRANMFGSFLIDESRGWGVGDDAAVWYTDDAGRNWTLRNCGIQGNLDDIYFINDTLGWIAGEGLYRSDFGALKRQVILSPPEANLEICDGDSLQLMASDGFSRYSWTDGLVGQSRYVSKAGTYIVRAFDKFTCLESYDTIQIALKPSVVPEILATKVEFCEGDSALLTINKKFINQRWGSGDTTESIVVRESGSYTVTTLDEFGCTKTSAPVTIVVHPNPRPVIMANRSLTICLDETVTLSAPPGYYQYRWSNGESTSSITVATAGQYSVTVVDEFGCVGTSPEVTVVVLNTRNKISFDLTSIDGAIRIDDHPVGGIACRVLTIGNRSEDENYVIHRPFLIGNVTFSIPQAQLPIVIPPLTTRTIEICAAAIDTGMVNDTLVLPDTCSATRIPLRSFGLPIDYQGTSRCDVPVNTLVYRAGASYRLSAPYPLPADNTLSVQVMPGTGVSGRLVDVVGTVRGTAVVYDRSDGAELVFATADLPPGPYIVIVEADGMPLRSLNITVVR